MAKARQERWESARRRWPNLYQLLAGHFHQDFCHDYRSLDDAIGAATHSGSLEFRRQALRELQDCSASEEAISDLTKLLNEGFSVAVWFKKPAEARVLMNQISEGLNASISAELQHRYER